MNEIISFLKKRRSVTAKKMLPGKVLDSDLKDILECALRVPDHGALAPWRLIVIQKDMRKTIGEEILDNIYIYIYILGYLDTTYINVGCI